MRRKRSRRSTLERTVAEASEAILHTAEIVLRIPPPAKSRWHRAGVTPKGERAFDVVSRLVLVMFAVGWTVAIATARAGTLRGDAPGAMPITKSITSALTDPDAPAVAFLTQAALNALTPMRGESGKLRAHVQAPGTPVIADSLPEGARLEVAPGTSGPVPASAEGSLPVAPRAAGIWRVAVRVGEVLQPIADLSLITLRPRTDKQGGRIGLYYIGNWPGERGSRPRPGYAAPSGFIEVTPQNQDTYVSEHFRLKDFLTKGQQNVWPKYLVLDLKLVDKLELILSDLQARGHEVRGVTVMSGFRTPQYNARGGDPRGRAALSRHMYGDAADIFIDNDGDGRMDDLNGDGRVNLGDARVIEAAAERVERAHPALVGGVGVYPAASGHGPFTHIDTRGFRARWLGTGDS
jgi:uncharacterized protein YcbK (DUF882 family)